MYFSLFNVNTTNLFPAANTTNGGQLCTEFNLRSVDSVGTDPNVTFMLGPSFVHSDHEFDISHDPVKGDAILTIAAGKAVVNGHYFESLTPVDVDIAEGNSREVSSGGVSIRGRLVVGLRMMYSTNTTLVGTLDSEGNYEGVQIVILPESEFILPGQTEEAKTNPDIVTAHIKLGSFIYRNGKIQSGSIENNANKVKSIEAYRITGIDDMLSDDYFDKKGLTSNKFYTVAAKFNSEREGSKVEADFCDSTDSILRWDNNPKTFKESPDEELKAMLKLYPSARFLPSADGKRVFLFVPHKQVDNNSTRSVKDTDYKPIELDIPVANLASGTPGIVDINYSAGINAVLNKMTEFYHLPNGKFLMYTDSIESTSELPPIPSKGKPGDYIVVRQDKSLVDSITDSSYSWPSTMYMILSGVVSSIKYFGTSKPSGVEIATNYSSSAPDTSSAAVYNKYWDSSKMSYRGVKGEDYFTYYYVQSASDGTTSETPYYYVVESSGEYEWSDPVIITAQIPLAQENLIGGFFNAPDTSDYSDAGYVGLDSTGHLVLRDYGLLRTGVLAYQLGSDFMRSGLSLAELQNELNEYVNERVAFPNTISKESASNVINITIELPQTEDGGEIEIRGIDSRFNTCVYIHILGNAQSNTVVKIIDCEKVRIDSSIQGEPTIELHRCNLYYDAYVLNKLSTIKNMKLWYERFNEDDADLVVDNMTVRELQAAITVEDVDYWNTTNSNDNHYQYALQSLTFDNDGEVIGVGLYVRDCSTRDQLPEGKHIITADFTLPQGTGLIYPPARFSKKLKVSGTFVSTYVPSNEETMQVYTANISFSAITDVYNPDVSEDDISGKISILDDSFVIDSIGGDGAIIEGTDVDIPGMNVNEFHIFYGGVIG